MDAEDYTQKLLFQIVDEVPNYLFHYTSTEGFLGIVNSKSIWATEASALNDFDEISHVLKILESTIEGHFFRMGHKDNVWFHNIALQIRSIQRKFGRCFFSLCEGSDELPLWRSYANNGRGISIGFQTSELLKAANRQDFDLRKVVYDTKEQMDICAAFVNHFFQKFNIQEKLQRLTEPMLDDLDHFVQTAGPFMKNPTFSNEREWRLISNDRVHLQDPRWQFRASQIGIIPYIKIDLPESFSLNNTQHMDKFGPQFIVVMGPQCRRSPTAVSLQMLSQRVLGRGYGPSLSGSTYTD